MKLKDKILKKKIIVTNKDNQTNIVIPFVIEKNYERLEIDFSYSPQEVPESIAIKYLEEALPKYNLERDRLEECLPLLNLITVSLSYDGHYIGCRHNKESVQNIIISKNESSLGFMDYSIFQGLWELQLNLHCVCSEVEVNLQIEGVK